MRRDDTEIRALKGGQGKSGNLRRSAYQGTDAGVNALKAFND